MSRKDEYRDIHVSTEHKTLRIVGFVVALAVAVTAFTIGVLQIGHKDAGYQTVPAEADNDAMNYANGVTFKYFLEGKSREINSRLKDISSAYSASMKRAYKFLDASKEYTGYANLASINKEACNGSPEGMNVGYELYEILERAYEYTLRDGGYNMFAGAVYEYWNSILSLDEPEGFDPAVNSDEAARLEKLIAATADLSNFTLEFADASKYIVCLHVSKAYLELLEELEIPSSLDDGGHAILDLNLLHDAFLLEWVDKELESKGYDRGYFESASGLMISMSGNAKGEYCKYDFSLPEPAASETVPVCGKMCASHFRNAVAGESEFGRYSIESGEKRIFRSPDVNTKFGRSSQLIANSYVISTEGNPTEAVYRNIVMSGAQNAEELRAVIAGFDEKPQRMDYEYHLFTQKH